MYRNSWISQRCFHEVIERKKKNDTQRAYFKHPYISLLQIYRASKVRMYLYIIWLLPLFPIFFHTFIHGGIIICTWQWHTLYIQAEGFSESKLLFVLEIWKDKTDLLVTSIFFGIFRFCCTCHILSFIIIKSICFLVPGWTIWCFSLQFAFFQYKTKHN